MVLVGILEEELITATSLIFAVGVLLVALAIAAAVFRTGMLDIDLLLNRTLTYAALTAILVAAFILISTAADRALVAMTGQRSDLVLVLTVVPLAIGFLPLRAALQRFAGRFLSGTRVLTVLFVDIAGSTELAVRIGGSSLATDARTIPRDGPAAAKALRRGRDRYRRRRLLRDV